MITKRVTLQTDRGILYPGGSSASRRSIWRSRQQTYAFVASVFVLYGIFSFTRHLVQGDDFELPISILPDASEEEPPSSTYEKEIITVGGGGDCPEYGGWASRQHEPRTGGRYNLPFMRPAPECRKVVVPDVEEVIQEMNKTIKDPDLFRLFENCFPNTLDTSVTWTGASDTNSEEELTFITTGDIHAMWLRDSANQLQSYVSLLGPPTGAKGRHGKASSSQDQKAAAATTASSHASPRLASLFRGAINLQARYILASPHCNAFQPPAEAAMSRGNDGNRADLVTPRYDPTVVFECKYELDSLAAFLQLSWDYYDRTNDAGFFIEASRSSSSSSGSSTTSPVSGRSSGSRKSSGSGRGRGRRRQKKATDGWLDAVVTILDTAESMRQPTYGSDGAVLGSPYRFMRGSNSATETLANTGNGAPVQADTGLVRSAFRPSDDSTTFQFLIPANMMLAKYLDLCADIVAKVEKEEERVAAILESETQVVIGESGGDEELDEKAVDDDGDEDGKDESVADRMRRMAKEVKAGIEKYGKINHPEFGEMYAYEVDGFWSSNLMDDANLPSLLSAPLTGGISRSDAAYKATRKFALSTANPYYGHGSVLNGTGGPHIGPGMAWPMSLIVGIMTSDDDDEIKDMLSQLISSTDGLGLIHESVSVSDAGRWTRPWFSWANGLFGQMILDLKARKPGILKTSFQKK